MEQHTIPNSYLKAWCDPSPLPPKHAPFVWLISKDGQLKRKRAPENAFKQSNRYTVKGGGKQSLTIEQKILGATENAFVRIRSKVEAREPLLPQDRFDLCAFATAMFARSKMQGDHFSQFFREIHNLVKDEEKQHGAPPVTSLRTERIAANGPASTVMVFMQSWPYFLMQMSMTFLCAESEEGFITSDRPFVMFNPDAHRLPPVMRGPAPGRDRRIEITLPITPSRLLLISHIYQGGYVDALQADLDELNRRMVEQCDEVFVSHRGAVKPEWFKVLDTPADRWENSPEGIASEQSRQRWLKAKAEWEASRRQNPESDLSAS